MTEANATSPAARMPNYPEPITPAESHPAGCIGCKLDAGPHAWTPPTAALDSALEWSSGVGGVQCGQCGRTTICQGFDVDPMGLGGVIEWVCRQCYERWEDDSD